MPRGRNEEDRRVHDDVAPRADPRRRVDEGSHELLDCNGSPVRASDAPETLDLSFSSTPWCVDCRRLTTEAVERNLPSGLSSLVLSDLGLDCAQTETVCRRALQGSPALLVLVLDRNSVDHRCLRVLSESRHLRRLDLEGAVSAGVDERTRERTGGALAHTIRTCGLHHVQLSYNAPIARSALASMAQGAACASLRSLTLAACGIDDSMVGEIARICEDATHLECLDLSRNLLALPRACAWPPSESLLTLDVSMNPLRPRGCRTLISSILCKTHNLRFLRLQGCEVGDAVQDLHVSLSRPRLEKLSAIDVRDNAFHYGHREFLRDERILYEEHGGDGCTNARPA